MALIYQSAAWILAGLLLAIIVFLIVAILVNKKKKWVQMSCYSAPKKVRRRPPVAEQTSLTRPRRWALGRPSDELCVEPPNLRQAPPLTLWG